MATVALIFERRNVLVGAVFVDASLSEQHNREAEITDHPVESGANIVDHRRLKPDTVTIEGLISNTPLPLPSDESVSRVFAGQGFASASSTEPTRAGQAFQDLRALFESNELITVVTSAVTYENMLIVSLSVPRDAKTGQALRFSAVLKEIRLASARTVEVDAKGLPSNDQGKKAAPATPEPTRRQSFLFQTGAGSPILDGIAKLRAAVGK